MRNIDWGVAIRHFFRVYGAPAQGPVSATPGTSDAADPGTVKPDTDPEADVEPWMPEWSRQIQARTQQLLEEQLVQGTASEDTGKALALPVTPGPDHLKAWVSHQMGPVYQAITSAPKDREDHVRDVLEWFQKHLTHLTRETSKLLRYNLPALGRIDALRTIAPSVIEHMRLLILEENDLPKPPWFTHVLWGFALAHEQGARGEVRGTAREILDWLRDQDVVDPSVDLRKFGRALPWLAHRSPLFANVAHTPSGAVVRVVRLDWFGAPPASLFVD